MKNGWLKTGTEKQEPLKNGWLKTGTEKQEPLKNGRLKTGTEKTGTVEEWPAEDCERRLKVKKTIKD